MTRILALILLASTALVAGTVALVPAPQEDNPELQKLYEEDQGSRENLFRDGKMPSREEVESLNRLDAQRRKRVLEIIEADGVKTGADYYHAGMVFQHGDKPEDFLRAHVLASVAGFKGHDGGKWLAAAALDRYLQRIERPQIFGTQKQKPGPDADWTMEPFAPEFVTNAIREEYRVPPL